MPYKARAVHGRHGSSFGECMIVLSWEQGLQTGDDTRVYTGWLAESHAGVWQDSMPLVEPLSDRHGLHVTHAVQ
jgi:hypothetical protein